MEDEYGLNNYLDALGSLLEAAAGPDMDVASHGTYRRHFKDGDKYFWVEPTSHGFRRLLDENLIARLDARWTLVERIFASFAELQPHLRPVEDEEAEPRPVQGWEWSCIGLHQLWKAWGAQSRCIQADLRPALLDDEKTRQFEAEEMHDYELLFASNRVDSMTRDLREERREKNRWQEALIECVEKHQLGPGSTPFDVLAKLRSDKAAQKIGHEIVFTLGNGTQAIDIRAFQRSARKALAGELKF